MDSWSPNVKFKNFGWKKKYYYDKESWSISIENICLDCDDKTDELRLERHTNPCVHSDGSCKPACKQPYSIVWFPEEISLISQIFNFIGGMIKLYKRYWLETEDFFIGTGKNTEKTNQSILPTVFL